MSGRRESGGPPGARGEEIPLSPERGAKRLLAELALRWFLTDRESRRNPEAEEELADCTSPGARPGPTKGKGPSRDEETTHE